MTVDKVPDGEQLRVQAERSLRIATQYSFKTVHQDGHWLGPMSSDVTITSEWIFLLQAIGRPISEPDRQAYERHILDTQQEDGSWPIAPQYPYGGNLSATIEAYLALKIIGLSTSHPAMRKAREFVLSHGGVEKMRIFTRFNLALFGLLPWSALPQMPPELIFIPSWFPINLYKFSSWARGSLIPFCILRCRQPLFALPNGKRVANDFIDELWLNPHDKNVPYAKPMVHLWRTNKISLLFQLADLILWFFLLFGFTPFRRWAINSCVQWMVEHQEESGDWAGIFPPMQFLVMILHIEGFDHDYKHMRVGLEALDRFVAKDCKTGAKWMQPCVSPVWDTFLMVRGLVDAGTIPDRNHRLLREGIRWCKDRQCLVDYGDWKVYRPNLAPGGFSFEYENTWYPDVDDTGAGILAFLKQDPSSLTSTHVLKATEWILGMQNRDGGWAAFDVQNDALFLNSIPFSDMDALCDPSSADVAGRILEAFGLMLQLNAQAPADAAAQLDRRLVRTLRRACDRSIAYLEREQEACGAWYGRWGVNYIYGTSNVLCGLVYFADQARVRRMIPPACRWLERTQNADGGWGEGLASYIEGPQPGDDAASTPSQTAWAVMGLLVQPDWAASTSVERGVRWLVEHQTEYLDEEAGQAGGVTWPQAAYTGTGFPGHFYLGYFLYRHYFPLMALGRYVSAVREGALAAAQAQKRGVVNGKGNGKVNGVNGVHVNGTGNGVTRKGH